MLTKPTNACKCIKVSNVIDMVFLLHVSTTLVAILREMYRKGWIYRDITKICEQMHRCVENQFSIINDHALCN